jgi:hypothetical protein
MLAVLFIGFTPAFSGFFIYSVLNPEILIDDAPHGYGLSAGCFCPSGVNNF